MRPDMTCNPLKQRRPPAVVAAGLPFSRRWTRYVLVLMGIFFMERKVMLGS